MITRDAAHRYTYEGVQYPGVTTVLDCLGATFSVASNYGAKHASLAAIDLANELPKMIETVGREGAAKAIAQAGVKYRDETSQLGTEVHALADLVVRGLPTPSMTETQRGRVLHYAKWWEGELLTGAKLRLSEAMVVRPNDPDNPQSGWGGTFDLLYYDADGCTVLADIKTGKGVYKEAVLQLAAYGMASLVQPASDNVMVPAKVYPMPLPDKYKIIHVTADGVRPIDVDVTVRERMAFLACLDLHHWIESMKGKRL
jgi:hypothetical protein